MPGAGTMPIWQLVLGVSICAAIFGGIVLLIIKGHRKFTALADRAQLRAFEGRTVSFEPRPRPQPPRQPRSMDRPNRRAGDDAFFETRGFPCRRRYANCNSRGCRINSNIFKLTRLLTVLETVPDLYKSAARSERCDRG